MRERDVTAIDRRYVYDGVGGNTGVCIDVSVCGDWLLLKRDSTRDTEKDMVAVLIDDPDVRLLPLNETGVRT